MHDQRVRASFGFEGGEARFCVEHAGVDVKIVNLNSKPCLCCGDTRTAHRTGVCPPCRGFRAATAEGSTVAVFKEWCKESGLDLKSAGVRLDMKPVDAHACDHRQRPDIYFTLWPTVVRCQKDFAVVIECDENSHRHYEASCEATRMLNLAQTWQVQTLYIRFNPDPIQTAAGDLVNGPDWLEREQGLKECLTSVLNSDSPPAFDPLTGVGVIYLYYDVPQQCKVDAELRRVSTAQAARAAAAADCNGWAPAWAAAAQAAAAEAAVAQAIADHGDSFPADLPSAAAAAEAAGAAAARAVAPQGEAFGAGCAARGSDQVEATVGAEPGNGPPKKRKRQEGWQPSPSGPPPDWWPQRTAFPSGPIALQPLPASLPVMAVAREKRRRGPATRADLTGVAIGRPRLFSVDADNERVGTEVTCARFMKAAGDKRGGKWLAQLEMDPSRLLPGAPAACEGQAVGVYLFLHYGFFPGCYGPLAKME